MVHTPVGNANDSSANRVRSCQTGAFPTDVTAGLAAAISLQIGVGADIGKLRVAPPVRPGARNIRGQWTFAGRYSRLACLDVAVSAATVDEVIFSLPVDPGRNCRRGIEVE
jgi:hypothetical protein